MLAAAPITWGVCELPGWGVELPYGRVLDEMAAAGFRGTELGPHGYLPSDPDRLRQALRTRGLSLVGAFCPLALQEPERAAESLRAGQTLAHLLSDLECPTLVAADAGDDRRRAIAGRVTAADALPDDNWRRFGDRLADLALRCAPLGVQVV
ncbi:MAG: sugar phosphate isomerase/epimerase family protein, partial [Chloroflexota bacterium]